MHGEFRNELGFNVFTGKYQRHTNQTWAMKAREIVLDTCGRGVHNQYAFPVMSREDMEQLIEYIRTFKFLPGGRYIYYAGRAAAFWNNCYLLRAEEDTREEWAALAWRATSCLMVGGGIGADYSRLRPKGAPLGRTGGVASGPLSLMYMLNEIGRNVKQGGSRRSAIYASLNWQHEDARDFLAAKNWQDMPAGDNTLAGLKRGDFNFPAPLDMTNVSLNYDDAWLANPYSETFKLNVRQAMMTGEPGFSFNFGDKQNETLRNACTEVVSEDDSDVCNLGSVNLAAVKDLAEFKDVVRLASKFLVCGTLRATLPYEKVYKVRDKNRRLGLGLMGIHEFLLKNGKAYGWDPILRPYMEAYRDESEAAANDHCDRFFISRPVAYRAIAPTGTIGILAGTSTGIEPLVSVAYRRRYLVDGTRWKYQYVVDGTAQTLIQDYGLDPDKIETAFDLAQQPERRIAFQAKAQEYVDQAISSTINLPPWGSEHNNEDTLASMTALLVKYGPKLRGLTFYPDGSRGGQPITKVEYADAVKHAGVVYEDNSELVCKEGICGI